MHYQRPSGHEWQQKSIKCLVAVITLPALPVKASILYGRYFKMPVSASLLHWPTRNCCMNSTRMLLDPLKSYCVRSTIHTARLALGAEDAMVVVRRNRQSQRTFHQLLISTTGHCGRPPSDHCWNHEILYGTACSSTRHPANYGWKQEGDGRTTVMRSSTKRCPPLGEDSVPVESSVVQEGVSS